jgi:hypothetical protein
VHVSRVILGMNRTWSCGSLPWHIGRRRDPRSSSWSEKTSLQLRQEHRSESLIKTRRRFSINLTTY